MSVTLAPGATARDFELGDLRTDTLALAGLMLVAMLITAMVVIQLRRLKQRDWDQLTNAQILASQDKTAEALSALAQLLTSNPSGRAPFSV